MNGEHEFYCAKCGHVVLSLNPEQEKAFLDIVKLDISAISPSSKAAEEASP